MTLPSSGSLSYNSIRAEFGSPSSNVYLSLYYRGGPYTYNIPQNSSITTGSSSTISVNNFYGTVGRGPFLQFSGATNTTGGKNPITYYGAGGPGLPGVSDTSITVGGTGYTFHRFYSSGNTMYMTGTPNANITSAPTWSQRNFYCYNSSGSLAVHYRTGWAAGRGTLQTLIGGVTGQQPRTGPSAPPSTWVYEQLGNYPSGGLNFSSDQSLSQVGNANPVNPQPSPSLVSGAFSSLSQYIVVKAN